MTDVRRVGVVGLGTMGAGIAQLAVEAGLETVGREVLYSLRPDRVDAAARWMADLAAGWDSRLQRIKRIAESGE